MLIGHYAVALGAKRYAPQTSLGTLVAAAVLLDLIWPVLVLTGFETFAITPGATAVTPLTFTSYPLSHSLMMSGLWAAAFSLIYFRSVHYRASAIVLFVLVVSHWFLDLMVHAPDLPLTPWEGARLGFGLWNSLPLTLALELSLFGVGAAIYATTTRARDRIGKVGFWIFAALAVAAYFAALFSPPPPDVTTAAWSANVQWVFVILAAWIDKHRAGERSIFSAR